MNELFKLPFQYRFAQREFVLENRIEDGRIGVFLKKTGGHDVELQAFFSSTSRVFHRTILAGTCLVEETNQDAHNPSTFLDYPVHGVCDIPLYLADMEVLSEFRGIGIGSALFQGLVTWLEHQVAIEVATFSKMGKERMYRKYIEAGYHPITVCDPLAEQFFLQPGFHTWVYKAYNYTRT